MNSKMFIFYRVRYHNEIKKEKLLKKNEKEFKKNK